MEKKGVSPVIATILLIAIVIILAIIIFLWARGFVAEKAQKEGRAVEFSCSETNFDAGVFYDDGDEKYLDIVNDGNIPLYGFEIKEFGTGTVIVQEIIPQHTITIGDSATRALNTDFENGDSLLIVPIILGQTDDGVKIAHTCTDEVGVAVTVGIVT
jgi:flagellin-like protein